MEPLIKIRNNETNFLLFYSIGFGRVVFHNQMQTVYLVSIVKKKFR